jgi:hypothetical protein
MSVNKILLKYIHMRSCFKEFIARNMMVQSDFNLDTWFSMYDFFYFKRHCIHALMSYFLDCPACSVGWVSEKKIVCGASTSGAIRTSTQNTTCEQVESASVRRLTSLRPSALWLATLPPRTLQWKPANFIRLAVTTLYRITGKAFPCPHTIFFPFVSHASDAGWAW